MSTQEAEQTIFTAEAQRHRENNEPKRRAPEEAEDAEVRNLKS
jgi:hypothetical protein